MQREKWTKKSQIVLEVSAYWGLETKNLHQNLLDLLTANLKGVNQMDPNKITETN